jgi:hypothetical protein
MRSHLAPPTVVAPIFIVGPGRSGTTLLSSLLSAHSRIAITPETHFMKRAEAYGLARGGPVDFEHFWKRYTSWTRFRDLGIDADVCRSRIVGERPSFEAIFSAVLATFLESTGKQRVGEKTPGHAQFIHYIFDWFRDARVIGTRRDPRAVVASQLQTAYVRLNRTPLSLRSGVLSGSRLRDVAFYADDWARVYSERLGLWESDPRVHVIAYEDLVQDAEGQLRGICHFLEETFEPSMLEVRTPANASLPREQVSNPELQAWRDEHHTRAQSRVSAESLSKWRHELSPWEVAMIEGRCASSMERFGYATSQPPIRRALGRALTSAVLHLERMESRGRGMTRRAIRGVRRRLSFARWRGSK